MKKLTVILLFTFLVCTFASADTIITADAGYMMTTINFDDGWYLTENAIAFNVSMFVGEDTLKGFFSASFGYIVQSELFDNNGNFFLSLPLQNYDTTINMDLLGGIGARLFLSDGLLLIVGVGAHLYMGTISQEFVHIEYITAGVGGLLNILVLVDSDMGVNLGVKAAYDPLILSSTSAYGYVDNAWMIMPYVGFSLKM